MRYMVVRNSGKSQQYINGKLIKDNAYLADYNSDKKRLDIGVKKNHDIYVGNFKDKDIKKIIKSLNKVKEKNEEKKGEIE